MKLQNNLFVLCALVMYLSEVNAMQCVIKRLSSHPIQKRKLTTNFGDNLYAEIEAVGLKKCAKAYITKRRCKNKICCKNVFAETDTIKSLEKAQLAKAKFLQRVDRTEGRLSFLLRAQEAYNKLSCIEEKLTSCYSDEYELSRLIHHQKTCLQNQVCVIQEDSPDLDATVKIRFIFHEKLGKLVADIDLLPEVKGDKE